MGISCWNPYWSSILIFEDIRVDSTLIIMFNTKFNIKIKEEEFMLWWLFDWSPLILRFW